MPFTGLKEGNCRRNIFFIIGSSRGNNITRNDGGLPIETIDENGEIKVRGIEVASDIDISNRVVLEDLGFVI